MSYTNGVTSSPLLQTLLTQADATSAAKTARGTSSGAQGSMAAQDSAQLSTAASALLRTSEADDVRTEKVQSIQAAIANGTYSVSSGDVAQKLIQSLLR